MTNGQINCFLTVVDEGSFAKAAAALYISQPAISKSIYKMEEELGFSILERKVGALRPTAAGEMLYSFFNTARGEYNELISSIRSNMAEPMGIINIGCPETWNPSKFFGRIKEHFGRLLPSVELNLECHTLPALFSKLQSGKLDILISHEFHPPVQYGYTVRHLTNTGCGILYSNSFMPEVKSLAELRDADFLHFDSDVEKKFGVVVRQLCSEHGFSPKFKNCGQFASALFKMSCGQGVMFFTDWDNAINNKSYTYLPLNYSSPVNIIYPSVTSNANTHIFAAELLRLFSEKTGE